MKTLKTIASLKDDAHLTGLSKSKQGKELGEMTAVGLGHVSTIVGDILTQHTHSIIEMIEGIKPKHEEGEKPHTGVAIDAVNTFLRNAQYRLQETLEDNIN